MKGYLVGYYGMHNSGDDALMLAATMGCQRFLDLHELQVSCYRPINLPGYYVQAAPLSDPQHFPGENRLRHYWHAFGKDAVVFGGGSVLHTAQDINIKRSLVRITGKGYALGVGLGPFQNSAAEKACAEFLNECEFVGVRDKHSLALAQSLAPAASVKSTFDLAPLLLEHPQLFAQRSDHKQGICVCLCPQERLLGRPEDERARLQSLATALNEVALATGEKITLLDFNGHSQLGDGPVHQELRALLSPELEISHIAYQNNPLRVMQILASFKVVLGMRLHASILAFLVNTPVISLNYHDKCEGWCEQIGLAEKLQFLCYRTSKSAQISALDSKALADVMIQGLDQGFQQPKLSQEEALTLTKLNWV